MKEKTQKKLSQIQANILKPHGRNHCWYLFFKLNGNGIHGFKEERKAISHFKCQITSGLEQVEEAINRKKFGIEGKVLTTLFLSKNGYEKLNNNVSNRESLKLLTLPLSDLGLTDDHMSQDWLKHHNLKDFHNCDDEYSIDLGIMIADDHLNVVDAYSMFVEKYFTKSGFDHLFTEKGEVIKKNGAYYEPFGYKDGLSKLPFWKQENEELDFKSLSVVLDNNGGSMVAFLKLEQKVKEFCNQVLSISKELIERSEEDIPPLEEEEKLKEVMEYVYAQIMGRYRDGTPLVVGKEYHRDTQESDFWIKNAREIIKSNWIDSFNEYDLDTPPEGGFNQIDPHGKKCPFFAHIRKANLRDQIHGVAKNNWCKDRDSNKLVENKEFSFSSDEQNLISDFIKKSEIKFHSVYTLLSLYKKLKSDDPLSLRGPESLIQYAFDQLQDNKDTYCPNTSHIRIARRGIPYNEPLTQEVNTNQNDKVEQNRLCKSKYKFGSQGLLFMSYQRTVCQFQKILEWMRLEGFPSEHSGVDPIFGRTNSKEPLPYIFKNKPSSDAKCIKKNIKFSDYVIFIGGEYFYAPPMKWINDLGSD